MFNDTHEERLYPQLKSMVCSGTLSNLANLHYLVASYH